MAEISASAIGAALDMPITLARVAALLVSEDRVSSALVEEEHKVSKGSGRVYVHRLRKFLGDRHDIKIYVDRDSGYYLKDNDRERLVGQVRVWLSKQFHG